MMTLTISLGQMDVKLGRPDENLAHVQVWVKEAARRGSDILVLPELWSTGYDLANAVDYATDLHEGIFAEVASLARTYGIHILGSCLSLLGEGRYGNTAVLHDPSGKALGVYSKVHLFGLMDEDKYLTRGNGRTLTETEWGKSGLAICYDLRFPELFRAYALDGAQIILLVAQWPYPRLAHWRTLLRARAIENQVFIVACNRVGITDGATFLGHSAIIDPWGEIIIEAGESESLISATIELDQIDVVRAQMPVLSDRQSQAYLCEENIIGSSK